MELAHPKKKKDPKNKGVLARKISEKNKTAHTKKPIILKPLDKSVKKKNS